MRPWVYTLIGQTPVPVDLDQIDEKTFRIYDRRVKLTHVGPYRISTVFLGVDHQYGFLIGKDGPPILFETMVWIDMEHTDNGLEYDRQFEPYQKRCSTWEQAEQQHREAVEQFTFPGDEVVDVDENHVPVVKTEELEKLANLIDG